MVVVPAFAEGDRREQPVVATVVAGGVAPASPAVRQRIDRHRRGTAPPWTRGIPRPAAAGRWCPVPAPSAAAPRPARTATPPAPPGSRCRSGRASAVREREQVADARGSVRKPARVRNQPAWLRQKPLRGVRIPRRVGVHVVVPMVCGPPQRPALHRRRTEHGERELHRARSAEAAMREIAVVEAGDREHARGVQAGGDPQRGGGRPRPRRGRRRACR